MTGLDETALTRALALAATSATERALTVTDLADAAGYSPFHFTRQFTAAVGISPGQYLTARRMETAKHLLLTDTEAVIDVAGAVGYDSLSSFARRFHATVGVAPGRLRRLADHVADRPPRPFSVLAAHPRAVRVHLHVPPSDPYAGDPLVWVGWYPQPAPIGLPRSGALVQGREHLDLPLHDGAPWLLAFSVAERADAMDHLAPSHPVVAAHPAPLTTPTEVHLDLRMGGGRGVPLLSALPALCRGARSAGSDKPFVPAGAYRAETPETVRGARGR